MFPENHTDVFSLVSTLMVNVATFIRGRIHRMGETRNECKIILVKYLSKDYVKVRVGEDGTWRNEVSRVGDSWKWVWIKSISSLCYKVCL
jgi:hypothetical protein